MVTDLTDSKVSAVTVHGSGDVWLIPTDPMLLAQLGCPWLAGELVGMGQPSSQWSLLEKYYFPWIIQGVGEKKFTCQFYPTQGNTIQGGHVTCRSSADGLCKQVMWLSIGGFDGWHKQVMWLTRKGNFDGLHKLLKNALFQKGNTFLGNVM